MTFLAPRSPILLLAMHAHDIDRAPSPLASLNLPPVENKPWRFRGFPTLAWWAPKGTAGLDDFRAYGVFTNRVQHET